MFQNVAPIISVVICGAASTDDLNVDGSCIMRVMCSEKFSKVFALHGDWGVVSATHRKRKQCNYYYYMHAVRISLLVLH